MGDLNDKVRSEKFNLKHLIGKYGLGTRNKNGDFSGDLIIIGTLFPYKLWRKAYLVSPVDNMN